jgi:hypothetical protein
VPAFKAVEVEGCTFTVGQANATFYVDNNITAWNRWQSNLVLVLVVIFTQDNVPFFSINFCQDVIHALILNFVKKSLQQSVLLHFPVFLDFPVLKELDRVVDEVIGGPLATEVLGLVGADFPDWIIDKRFISAQF